MDKHIGDYVLDNCDFGKDDIVWRAHHNDTKDSVIMKRSNPKLYDKNLSVRASQDLAFNLLFYEYALLASVEHEGICEEIELFELNDTFWLVLKDYGDYSIREIDNVSDAGKALLNVSSAISYLHKRNIVHGDIKPKHILGDGVLIDFNSAYEPSFWKQYGMPPLKGTTWNYEPPNYDRINLQPRYDVFGFCRTAFETLQRVSKIEYFCDVRKLVKAGLSEDFKNLPTMAEIESTFRKAFS